MDIIDRLLWRLWSVRVLIISVYTVYMTLVAKKITRKNGNGKVYYTLVDERRVNGKIVQKYVGYLGKDPKSKMEDVPEDKMRIVFKTDLKRCPGCNKRLVAYRSDQRTIISIELGMFTAVHRILKCRKCGMLFRSEKLAGLIEPYCTYASDIMIDAAVKRFIEGRSCLEIGEQSGIFERHARNLSNLALDIFAMIHEEYSGKLRESLLSYILQIDGTTDSDFSMIMVVRDSISGFTLYSEKCFSESEENIVRVLECIKERFGIPSGAICDMRSGIISAIKRVFPGIPVRICLLHFLRDLGKNMMLSAHLDLGKMINMKGMKSGIKRLLRSCREYDPGTIMELDNGYCSNPGTMAGMIIRRILEDIVAVNGSSGYGFPFSMKHLTFYIQCIEARKDLLDLSKVDMEDETRKILDESVRLLSIVACDSRIAEAASSLRTMNILFQSFRNVFRIPGSGDLSDPMDLDPGERIKAEMAIHESCNTFIGQLKTGIQRSTDPTAITASMKMIHAYEKWKKMLFAQNADSTIPRTNNSIEQFFRKIRRNVRKRCGNISTGRYLSLTGEKIAIFQNIAIPDYRKIVFGTDDVASIFAHYRKRVKITRIPRKVVISLVEKGKRDLISGKLRTTPYSDEFMEEAYAERNKGGPNGLLPP